MNNKNLTKTIILKTYPFNNMINFKISETSFSMIFYYNNCIIDSISLYYFDDKNMGETYGWEMKYSKKHNNRPFEIKLQELNRLDIGYTFISSKEFINELEFYDEDILYDILGYAPMIY